MKKIQANWNEWIVRFLFIMLVIIGYKLIANYQEIYTAILNFIQVLSPFILGFVLAYLLSGAQFRIKRLLEKKPNTFLSRNSQPLSVLLLYLLLFTIVFLLLNYIVPLLITNTIELIKSIPAFVTYLLDLSSKIEMEGLSSHFSIEEFAQKILSNLSIETALNKWAQSLSSIGQFSINLSSFVLNSFLTLVISIYTLLYKESIFAFLNDFFGKILPEKFFQQAKFWLQTTNKVFYKFVTSQFLDACIIAVLSTIILTVLRVRFALSLGLLLGMANMIPYFGSIFASIATAVITFFTGGLSQALITLVSLTVLQQIDGNIIGPRIMAGALNLNPIIIIISITIGGAYLGILGMFLAVPVAAILKIITMNWLKKEDEKEKTQQEAID